MVNSFRYAVGRKKRAIDEVRVGCAVFGVFTTALALHDHLARTKASQWEREKYPEVFERAEVPKIRGKEVDTVVILPEAGVLYGSEANVETGWA